MVKKNLKKKVLVVVLAFILFGFGCKQSPFFEKSKDPDSGKPYLGLIKLSFFHAETEELIPVKYIKTATLIRYTRQQQDKGVEIKRWDSDKSGKYKYVERDRQELNLSDFAGGPVLLLESGMYQIKHNSVSGQPPSGYYGKSNYFEIRAGEEPMEVKILLNSAI